ncbi:hypothetical protein SAMN04488128_10233 [Chitinophaga eiseniae]|uniref:Uncharacterized protein n=2 Tax=Chitinophaga eiseniae TaxID=634771 RepID=A0A1T4PVW6_9BACT|nr:hypothetical protein SAMN04488128_10233 [Chitinophaga eiseniae]
MKISLLAGFTFILLALTACTKSYRERINEQLPANRKVMRANETSPPVSVTYENNQLTVIWDDGHVGPYRVIISGPGFFQEINNYPTTILFGSEINLTHIFQAGDVISVQVYDYYEYLMTGSTTVGSGNTSPQPVPTMTISTSSNDLANVLNITWTNDSNSSSPWCTDYIRFFATVKNGSFSGHATATARCSDNHVSLELPKGWYNDTVRVYIGKTGGYPICDENGIDYYFIVPGIFYSNQIALTSPYCNRYDIW